MNFFKINKNTSAAELSLPIEKEMYGIKIRKLPNGKYIQAMKSIDNIAEILLKAAFPDMNPDEIMNKMKSLDENLLIELAGKMFSIFPEQILKFIATLIECDYEKLYNEISPAELLEILQEFWKINDMTNFMNKLKGMVIGKIKN